jgi:hypothetical protein
MVFPSVFRIVAPGPDTTRFDDVEDGKDSRHLSEARDMTGVSATKGCGRMELETRGSETARMYFLEGANVREHFACLQHESQDSSVGKAGCGSVPQVQHPQHCKGFSSQKVLHPMDSDSHSPYSCRLSVLVLPNRKHRTRSQAVHSCYRPHKRYKEFESLEAYNGCCS